MVGLLPISAFYEIHQARLIKNFRFAMIAKKSLAGQVLGSVVAVIAAYYGYGVWSLVAQYYCMGWSNSGSCGVGLTGERYFVSTRRWPASSWDLARICSARVVTSLRSKRAVLSSFSACSLDKSIRRLLSGGAESVQRNHFRRRPAAAQYGVASAVRFATRFRETSRQLSRIVLCFCVAVTGTVCFAYDLGATPCRLLLR